MKVAPPFPAHGYRRAELPVPVRGARATAARLLNQPGRSFSRSPTRYSLFPLERLSFEKAAASN